MDHSTNLQILRLRFWDFANGSGLICRRYVFAYLCSCFCCISLALLDFEVVCWNKPPPPPTRCLAAADVSAVPCYWYWPRYPNIDVDVQVSRDPEKHLVYLNIFLLFRRRRPLKYEVHHSQARRVKVDGNFQTCEWHSNLSLDSCSNIQKPAGEGPEPDDRACDLWDA